MQPTPPRPPQESGTSDERMKQVEQFFGQHAQDYAVSPRHAHGGDLDRLLARLDLYPGQRALDVATGPGHVAFQLAARGLVVVGLDRTPEMIALAEQEQAARATAAPPVRFVLADAAAVPFDDGSFERVTCRRAAHHLPDLDGALREWARVLTPGGLLGISDLSAPDAYLDELNAVERMRDPSHQAAQSADQWMNRLAAAGFRLAWLEVTVEPMTPLEWLSPVAPDSPEGRRALTAIAKWPPATRAALLPNGTFYKYRLLLTAQR